MRMSRRMGLHASLGMNPDSVTVTGGAAQYWASGSVSPIDGWHNTNMDGTGYRYTPYTEFETYMGRGYNGWYYNAALAFKTSAFTGKGSRVDITFTAKQHEQNVASAFAFAAQLSKHDWSTYDAWMSGSKTYYSERLTSLPNDPNAIGRTTGVIEQTSVHRTITVTLDAEILPNTEYVLYLISTTGVQGQLLDIERTDQYPMTITVTE